MRAILILLLSVLAGCASGVKMTDEDSARCKAEGCTAWTESELGQLAQKFFRDGYLRGAQSSGSRL